MEDLLTAALKKLFGLSYLFPYQRLVISNILEAAAANGLPLDWANAGVSGADCTQTPQHNQCEETPPADDTDRESFGKQIVILPTGAGKSLCFQFPAMLLRGPTLVLYPLLSLMADQERSLREKGLAPVLLRGGQSEEERRAIWKQLESGASRFIIANPEVLLAPRMKEKLKTLKIAHVVIDEAHCVSEWGESFRPAYLQIGEIITSCESPLVTAFTATASAPVLEKIGRYIFGSDTTHRIIGNPDRANIRYAAQGCVLRDLAVRDILLESPLPAIVFCSSRPGTQKLAAWLRAEFRELRADPAIRPRFYHAGLSREEKTAVEKWFFANDKGVLVSTCAYGMGVDKADIRTVIHRDCPPSIEAYLQESGRAGRDGNQSQAILLWGPDDDRRLSLAQDSAENLRQRKLLDYARNAADCRRHALLKLLDYEGSGETPETNCCDVCDNTASGTLREEKSVTEFFRKNRLSYTLDEAARLLSLSKNIRWTAPEAKQTVLEFIRMKKLKASANPLWKNKIKLV